MISENKNSRLTWEIVLRVWWYFAWRYALAFIAIMYLINMPLTMGFVAMGGDMNLLEKIVRWSGYLVSIGISIVVMRSMLLNKFKAFEIQIRGIDNRAKLADAAKETGNEDRSV